MVSIFIERFIATFYAKLNSQARRLRSRCKKKILFFFQSFYRISGHPEVLIIFNNNNNCNNNKFFLDKCCGLNLVLVQNFSNWFNFYFLLLCINNHNVEQWQIKLKPVQKTKPRTNLDHSIYTDLWLGYLHYRTYSAITRTIFTQIHTQFG